MLESAGPSLRSRSASSAFPATKRLRSHPSSVTFAQSDITREHVGLYRYCAATPGAAEHVFVIGNDRERKPVVDVRRSAVS